MSKFRRNCIAYLFALHPCFAASPADKPPGWASLDGGTTGGAGGAEVTVSTLDELNTALKTAGKRVIWIKGTLTGRADVATGEKTILGLPGARLVGGMDVTGSSSKRLSQVVIRNFEIEGPGSNDVDGADALTVQYADHVWIDHMWIHDGLDGNADITNEADLVTVSWTRFSYAKGGNHAFSNLIGSSDDKTGDRGKLRVTFLGTWWADGVVERMPRVRFGQVHVVNSLFTSKAASYCIRAGFEADIRAQANAFIGVKNPIDLFENDFKAVTSQDNLFSGATGDQKGSGTAFTPPYSLTVVPAAQVQALVSDAKTGAGPNLTWGTVALAPAKAGGPATAAKGALAAPFIRLKGKTGDQGWVNAQGRAVSVSLRR